VGNPQTGYVVAKGKRVLMTTTADPRMLRLAMQSVEKQTGLGTDALIAKAREKLGADTSAEMYLNVGTVVQVLNNFMAAAGGKPMQAPEGMLPISASLRLRDSNAVLHGFVPMDLLPIAKTLKHAGPGGGMGGPPMPPPEQMPPGPPPAPF